MASYHLWTGRVSGGVDVFFVISGFLITTTLLSQVALHGRIRSLPYLGRLALRLLPAAVTTLTAVVVAAWLFLPDLLWQSIGHQVRASALYVENWYLAATSANYLDQFAEKTPVEHFWALSVQGQFYLGWLLLFLLLAALVRRRPEQTVAIVGGGLSLVLVVSLTYSIWFTAANQPVAYFSTPARAWEFALGGLAALLLRTPPTSRSRLRWAGGWLGLVTLLSTGVLLHVSTVFPGYAALMPTGAALLILLSADSGLPLGADALLGARPLVWLGGLSYGIYLWHYPLMIFHRTLRNTETNSAYSGIAIIVTAVVLAWLTQRFVERPLLRFTQRSPQARRRGITSLIALIGVVAAVASVFSISRTSPDSVREYLALTRQLDRTAYDLEPCTGALARSPGAPAECTGKKVLELTPPPNLVSATLVPYSCDPETNDGVLQVCNGGEDPLTARATVLLIGDSHALAIRPALEAVARRHRWRLLFSYSPGCQTAAEPKVGVTQERCRRWMQKLTGYVRAGGIDVLFSIQSDYRRLEGAADDDDKTDSAIASYRRQWDRYAGSIKQLVVIRDTPKLTHTVLSCVARFRPGSAGRACSRARTTALKPDFAAIGADQDDDPSTTVVDLSDVFCNRSRCFPVIGGFVAYSDAVHLHTLFAPTLAPALDRAIEGAVTPAVRALLFGAVGPRSPG